MKLRVFTLRLDPETGAFDDRDLQAFVTDRTVISVADHFFTDGGAPVWALLVTYREEALFPKAGGGSSRRGPDPSAGLTQAEREVYDTLRAWRSTRAQSEGKPPYILFTNRQLAAIVRARPGTRAELEAGPGVGANRLRDYGAAVLEARASAKLPPGADPAWPVPETCHPGLTPPGRCQRPVQCRAAGH